MRRSQERRAKHEGEGTHHWDRKRAVQLHKRMCTAHLRGTDEGCALGASAGGCGADEHAASLAGRSQQARRQGVPLTQCSVCQQAALHIVSRQSALGGQLSSWWIDLAEDRNSRRRAEDHTALAASAATCADACSKIDKLTSAVGELAATAEASTMEAVNASRHCTSACIATPGATVSVLQRNVDRQTRQRAVDLCRRRLSRRRGEHRSVGGGHLGMWSGLAALGLPARPPQRLRAHAFESDFGRERERRAPAAAWSRLRQAQHRVVVHGAHEWAILLGTG